MCSSDLPKCKFCNFRLSIIEALTTKNKVTREAILNNSYNKMSAFHITATPFTIDKEDFVSISTIDIMHRKKKELIESVFYHDLINLAGSLDGYFDVITEIDEKEVLSHIPILKQISSQLLYEILSHREIIKAQQNTLEAEVSEIEITEFIEELQDKLKYHSACKKKQIIIESNCNDLVIMSDKRLLERVIINMIKNAAEASNKDQIVKATLTPLFDNILIEVHNDQYIEEDVRSNIFTYGFSTKGEGRGLGTYSIKLLGENLLKGKAWFETSKEAGTSFFLKVPLSIDEE